MATIRIKRTLDLYGVLRNVKVWIDGVHVGKLPFNSERTIDVPDGTHAIQASMDWCKSKALEINAQGDREIRVVVKTKTLLLAIPLCIIKPSSVFTVSTEEIT